MVENNDNNTQDGVKKRSRLFGSHRQPKVAAKPVIESPPRCPNRPRHRLRPPKPRPRPRLPRALRRHPRPRRPASGVHLLPRTKKTDAAAATESTDTVAEPDSAPSDPASAPGLDVTAVPGPRPVGVPAAPRRPRDRRSGQRPRRRPATTTTVTATTPQRCAAGPVAAPARTTRATRKTHPPGTVIKVRTPRKQHEPSNEPQKVTGPTRLEAKKQRRRDGRDAGPPPLRHHRGRVPRAARERRPRHGRPRRRPTASRSACSKTACSWSTTSRRPPEASLIGNVYLGRVQNVLPSMEAAFVDIGRGRNAVLYSGEVDWEAAAAEHHGGSSRRAASSWR